MATTKTVDVLVVGAGPVGLLFGYDMARLGHSVLVIDKKAGPTTQSRALFVSARTLDMLEHKGLAHHFLRHGVVLRGLQIFSQNTQLAEFDVSTNMPSTLFPQLTMVVQNQTEVILADALQTFEKDPGSLLQWNTELVSWFQNETGIEATVMHEAHETVIRAQYIIGADGCHSKVRKGDPSWTYDGHSVSTRFALADIDLKGKDVDRLKMHMNGFISKKGICGLIPIHDSPEHTMFRLVASMGPYERAPPNETRVTHGNTDDSALDLATVQALIDERVGLDLVASNPIWITCFHINERKANGFRRQRAFVIGDAAHCHSPAGGQGMNMGLQDADNLAWKLSLVLQGLAADPERVLDSFTIEREPVVDMTIKATSNATRLGVSNFGWVPSILSRWFISTVFSVQYIREYILSNVLQVCITLSAKSPLLRESHSGLIPAGQFLTDTHLLRRLAPGNATTSPLPRKSLRQIIYQSTRHVVLWVATRLPHQQPCVLTGTFLSSLRTACDPRSVRLLLIDAVTHAPQAADLSDQDDEDHWLDYNLASPDSLTHRVGLMPFLQSQQDPPAALVLIRPDLYVAHSALIHNAEQLDTALAFVRTLFL